MTTRPSPDISLVIDLQKSWREDLHPRDTYGKFSTVRGGSRVVAKNGKTGVVKKIAGEKVSIAYDGGGSGTLHRDSVIHENDHKKVMEAKKKAKKRATAGKKQSATKATNKADGRGKGKNLADPTVSKTPAKQKAPKKVPRKEEAINAPVLKRAKNQIDEPKEIKGKIKSQPVTANTNNVRQTQELKDYQDAGIKDGASNGLNDAWNSSEVQKLMAKPPEKRSEKKIREIAGKMTEDNKRLAYKIAGKRAQAMGIHVNNNIIGTKASKTRIAQATGYYGDAIQAGLGAMYETLHNVLSGAENPGPNTAIGAHVASRIKQKVTTDLYGLMNSIPAPHDIRGAIGDMRRAESTLAHDLGHTPSDKELGEHLMANSKQFKDSAITKPPRWDEKQGEWIATNKQETDPEERLKLLRRYADQQKTALANASTTDNSEVQDAYADDSRSPEENYERKERQSELEGTLPKAMKDMGLTKEQIEVFTLMHSAPSETRNRESRTSDEVAKLYNEKHGTNYGESWIRAQISAGNKVIRQAIEENHPAIERLKMLKSFVFNLIIKGIYEFDLVKSLSNWGMDHTVLEERFVRVAYARNLYQLKKSLDPTEYVGSYMTTDTGEVRANILELIIPGSDELSKAFSDFRNEFRKSIFPHKGTNHAVNEKASQYVKANKGKYSALHANQHDKIKAKKASGKQLTWSEELAIKNNGFWISWGGKKILVSGDPGSFGEIKYDSANEAHREEHNDGAQADKIDFHHEDEELGSHRKDIEDQAKKEWAEGANKKSGNALRQWANKNNVAWNKDEGKPETDEEGNLKFDHGDDSHKIDHGIGAFKDELENLKGKYKESQSDFQKEHGHKAHAHYTNMSDEDRAKYDAMNDDERAKATGEHHLANEDIRKALEDTQAKLKNAGSEDEKKAIATDFLNHMKELEKKNPGSIPSALRNTRALMGRSSNLGGLLGALHDAKSVDDLGNEIGKAELAESRTQLPKNVLKAGKYVIGNPVTGKQLIARVEHAFEGGRGGKGGKFTSVVKEAFDPSTGEHFTFDDAGASWGQLGKKLGINTSKLTEDANKDETSPMLKEISDTEFQAERKKTHAGLQDAMLHKNFKQVADNGGHKTFSQEMPDGTSNVFDVGPDGMLKDPIMRRLIKQRESEPIHNEDDLHKLLKRSVGNSMWTTLHVGSDIHTGDALGHHVKLMYDGKGAPKVVGGTYDGYRFIDSKDVPKGAVDPDTGEPIKALFKNGKLVDRRFSTKNDVPMETGSPVMYKDEDGKFKKGRINAIQDGKYKVTDGKGHLIGMFDKKELKPATAEGKINSKNGNAVVKLVKSGIHRLDTTEAFPSERAKKAFEDALHKAKVNKAFDEDGNLKEQLELSDPMMNRLRKVLGRSKAGRAMLSQFNTSHMPPELELHVPENLKAKVEAEGVRVLNNGTARVSTAKFEQLRDMLNTEGSGLSIEQQARGYLNEHFRMKDRSPKEVEELKQLYQPSMVNSGKPQLDNFYKQQFKSDSFLMDPSQGLFSTQLEGIGHLVERGRALAGHGMGTGKTILGVMAGMHYKAQQLAQGKKPKKTLIVAPKGILSDWGKEIGTHTNSKALYVGSGLTKKGMKAENGRAMFGQDGTEQESVGKNHFKKNLEALGKEDHDFHVMSYETFANLKDDLVKSGLYDNIAIDEVHAFKNTSSNRGKSLAETTSNFKNIWGLSGTPMENDAREVYNLIDTITGGRHELGSKKEFEDNYMIKDRNGKLTGVNPNKAEQLGDIVANVVQFRSGQDVKRNDGSKIQFPHLVGQDATEDNQNPPMDFIGDMADGSRDQKTTDYYGTKHSVFDSEVGNQQAIAKNGESYDVETHEPKNLSPKDKAFYANYRKLQAKYLPESKLQELSKASVTGYDTGKAGKSNYLTAMQKLQKYLNAPGAHKMYVGEGQGNAIESDMTDAQGEKTSKKGASNFKEFKGDLKAWKPGDGNYIVNNEGHKQYFESDGNGSVSRGKDGTPKLLDPLHHNNPKAEYLHKRLAQYLDSVQSENTRRRANGMPELMPKVVVKSDFTTFGTDIADGVIRDLGHPVHGHPELKRWNSILQAKGQQLGAGRFTGDADDREETKVGFRGNKKDYANNQGHLWATTVSPAGKEGVDFGNAHAMFHMDQNWNPQKMAQFTARVRRADSNEKAHENIGRANAVRVESLHMPGTIEDFIFNAEDAKMRDIKQVENSTRNAEKDTKFGDSSPTIGRGTKFTRKTETLKNTGPKLTVSGNAKTPKATQGGVPQKAVAKSLQLVVLL